MTALDLWMHLTVCVCLSQQTSLSYISRPIDSDDSLANTRIQFVLQLPMAVSQSVVMQRCKYVALKWAWTAALHDVIQCLLENVISSHTHTHTQCRCRFSGGKPELYISSEEGEKHLVSPVSARGVR